MEGVAGRAAPSSRPIVLIGFMGAGKTTFAAELAARLGGRAVDTDELIEREAGTGIAELFESRGEAGFRELEERVVLEAIGPAVEDGSEVVLSLGGGAVLSDAVRGALSEAFVVWLQVDVQTAWERARAEGDRPLARDRDAFARLLAEREPIYRELADAIVDAARAGSAFEHADAWIEAARALGRGRLVHLPSATGVSPALFGSGAVGELTRVFASPPSVTSGPGAPSRWFAAVDAAVVRAHPGLLERAVGTQLGGEVEVEAAEQRKTLAEAERVLGRLAELGMRRDDGLLAVGGGVVGDLAGFCAATYQRGVDVVQVPTTLVAQVDSAFGGKTGVDIEGAKNYVGAFHLPRAVLVDPGFLASLPEAEVSAGMAEVLKTALLAGGGLWERVRALEPLSAADFAPQAERHDELARIVFECAAFKLGVVAEDELDSGRRAILNLGHTVGHAIESATGYTRYRHGEAVALGLIAALRLSGLDDLRAELVSLLDRHGLPTALDPEISTAAIVEATGRDKKRTAEGVGFVLLDGPGEPRTGVSVDSDTLRRAVEELA